MEFNSCSKQTRIAREVTIAYEFKVDGYSL